MSNIFVSTSTIPNAGRGVFANRDFKQGDCVCYYDGIEVEIDVRKKPKSLSVYYHPIGCGSWKKMPKNMLDDLQKLENGRGIIGFRNPKTEEGVGQLINDGARIQYQNHLDQGEQICVDLKKCIPPDLLPDETEGAEHIMTQESYDFIQEEYISNSLSRANVYVGNDCKVYAFKNIKKGEELFYCYCPAYWNESVAIVAGEFSKITEKIVKRCLQNNMSNEHIEKFFKIQNQIRESPTLRQAFLSAIHRTP